MNKKIVSLMIFSFYLMISLIIINISARENPNVTLDIIIDGEGTVNKYPDQPFYLRDSTVQIKAIPYPGSRFDHWDGHQTGNTNPVTITMDDNKIIKAVFVDL